MKNRKLFNITHDILGKMLGIMPTQKMKIFVLDLQIRNGIFWGAISDNSNWDLDLAY